MFVKVKVLQFLSIYVVLFLSAKYARIKLVTIYCNDFVAMTLMPTYILPVFYYVCRLWCCMLVSIYLREET
jgi:hypothetical protein